MTESKKEPGAEDVRKIVDDIYVKVLERRLRQSRSIGPVYFFAGCMFSLAISMSFNFFILKGDVAAGFWERPGAKFTAGDCIALPPEVGEFATKNPSDFFLVRKVGKTSYLTDFFWKKSYSGEVELISENYEKKIETADRMYEAAAKENCLETSGKD